MRSCRITFLRRLKWKDSKKIQEEFSIKATVVETNLLLPDDPKYDN